jgi:AcrR family transcriptional regulator
MDDETARATILDAADRLFYKHGIRSVGMDQIRDVSGVSLKRLYRLFPAKDQLAEAVLRRRHQEFQGSLAAYVANRSSPRAKLLAVFDFLYEWFSEPDYRGCPFVNAFAELRANSDAVTAAVTEQKRAFAEFLADLVAGAGGKRSLAEQVYLLANGAMVAAAIAGSPEPARQAKRATTQLLDADRTA